MCKTTQQQQTNNKNRTFGLKKSTGKKNQQLYETKFGHLFSKIWTEFRSVFLINNSFTVDKTT